MDTPKGKRLRSLDKTHIWHPFTQMREWQKEEPIVIERAKGNLLIDTEGNTYIDGVSSLWVNLHGHGKKTIDRAIKEQLGKVSHSTLLGLSNIPSIELAERLSKVVPKGLKRVFYSDNGSTAVEIALKMAFQYWQLKGEKRTRFVAFTGAYHGDTVGAMSVGEIDVFVKRFNPLLFKTYRAIYPYCYRCPLKKSHPECNLICVESLKKILSRHHKYIAACIIEPMVQGAAGIVVSPPGFLKEVSRLCKEYGILLIADEVATGFGRTGRMFACEHEGVKPDFLCLAKGITGGYLPLAATLTTDTVYKTFLGRYEDYNAFFHGHTYTGNQLGCAAAIANLDVFDHENTIKNLGPKTSLFSQLLSYIRELKHVGDIRNIGLMAGIELVQARKSKKPFPPSDRIGYRVCKEASKGGVFIRPIGDTIILMPPLSIKKSELRRMVQVVYDSILEVTG